MRYLVEVEAVTLHRVEVETSDPEQIPAMLADGQGEAVGEPENAPFQIRRIRELEG